MIPIKSAEEIEIIKEGGKILAKIMKELEKLVQPGITTKELNRLAESLILNYGGKPSFKGHQNFPATLCTSINEEIVHCLPSDRVLKEGEIVSLDLGILYPAPARPASLGEAGEQARYGTGKSFHTDMAITLPVGKISPEVQRLIRVTKKALKRGLKKARPGNTFGDIGNTIQRYVEGQGFGIVRQLCGHGIGKNLHEEPQIPNYGKRKTGPEIKEGMVFCLEPMVTVGGWELKKAKDGYGYETADGSLSCHFEHTIATTKDGCRILTNY